MGFVKTADEVTALEEFYRNPRWLLDGIQVQFETTEEFVRSVLPPCLEPTPAPGGVVSMGRWQSACCGEFETACVFVNAVHEGDVGVYTLTMIVTGDTPVTWGREVWGEVKKTGQIGYYPSDTHFYGYAERNGTRLIQIDAELGGTSQAHAGKGWAFEIKAYPSATGVGLEYDPLLVKMSIDSPDATVQEATAKITLDGNQFDPLDTVPIVRVGRAVRVSGTPIYKVEDVITLPDRDAYIPYVYGRHYDDLRAFRVPPELSAHR